MLLLLLAFFFGSFSLVSFQATPRQQVTSHPNAAAALGIMADSDSENEGILNNIQRLVIRPPGHTGKAKKGHICFDGGYETMNLGRVDFITNQEYDLFIRPDTANPRERYLYSSY